MGANESKLHIGTQIEGRNERLSSDVVVVIGGGLVVTDNPSYSGMTYVWGCTGSWAVETG